MFNNRLNANIFSGLMQNRFKGQQFQSQSLLKLVAQFKQLAHHLKLYFNDQR